MQYFCTVKNKLGEADTATIRGFYYVRCRKSIGISTPWSSCNGSPDLAKLVLTTGSTDTFVLTVKKI